MSKLLGIHLHRTPTWVLRIEILNADCTRTITVMKYISHFSKGCNRKLLLHLYRSLICSRPEYGGPMYNLASKSVLIFLDHIQALSLRLALGALRTSPGLVLCSEAAEPPLSYRRLIFISNLMSYVSQFPQVPTFNSIFLP